MEKAPIYIILASLFIILLAFFLIGKTTKLISKKKQEKALYKIYKNSPYRKNNLKNKSRDKNLKKEQTESQEEFSDLEKYNEISKQPIREAPQIIDIVKPIGRWTNFIIKQKLSYLYNFFAVRKDDNKPYWQTVIDAQAKTQGKDKGKGR